MANLVPAHCKCSSLDCAATAARTAAAAARGQNLWPRLLPVHHKALKRRKRIAASPVGACAASNLCLVGTRLTTSRVALACACSSIVRPSVTNAGRVVDNTATAEDMESVAPCCRQDSHLCLAEAGPAMKSRAVNPRHAYQLNHLLHADDARAKSACSPLLQLRRSQTLETKC